MTVFTKLTRNLLFWGKTIHLFNVTCFLNNQKLIFTFVRDFGNRNNSYPDEREPGEIPGLCLQL
jgi:hypothetical protein